MHAALEVLLREAPDPEPVGSLEAWWERHRRLAARFPRPIDQALVAGLAMDSLGYAFASGYQAAGAALLGPASPRSGDGEPGALCATEAGGVHPGAIETKLTRSEGGLRLSGRKSFVTLGPFARRLWVVASEGHDAEGKNRLRVVAIDKRPGVTVEPLPPAPFIPEIPHAVLALDEVAVADDEVLPGDGYTAYLKPFRTVEDCYVHAALIGWLLRTARMQNAPRALLQDLLAAAVTIHGLATADPSAAGVHIALAGALERTRAIVREMEPLLGDAWQRDRVLLDVAGKARALRLEAAWRRVIP